MQMGIRSYRRTAAWLAGTILAIAFTRDVKAAPAGLSFVAMFPKDSGEFSYADLKRARALPWFAAFKEQLLPSRYRGFEQFLAATGTDPDSQVDALAWAWVPDAFEARTSHSATKAAARGDIVGVALGRFNPSSAEMYFENQGWKPEESHGERLFPMGNGRGPNEIYFVFLDSDTAAFGPREMVERVLNVREGGEESLMRSDQLYPLIEEANDSSMYWAVLNPAYSQLALQQLAPELDQFPVTQQLAERVKNVIVQVDAPDSLTAKIQVICGSPADATLMASLIEAGLMLQQNQMKDSDPDLAEILNGAVVAPQNDRAKIALEVEPERMTALLKLKAFAAGS
jgi:hypothetical protein